MHVRHPDRRHRARATLLGGSMAALALTAAAVCGRGVPGELDRLDRPGPVDTLDAVPVLLRTALLLALLWAAMLTMLATRHAALARPLDAATASRGRPGHRRAGPAARLAGVLLAVTACSAATGTSSALATTAPATASRTPVAPVADAQDRTVTGPAPVACAPQVPEPGWLPDRPAPTDQVARGCASLVTGSPVPDHSGEVVVRRGDTLWSIAAADLGPQADARAIAARWPRWYAANRDVIGGDPDLLTVGTRLRAPGHSAARATR